MKKEIIVLIFLILFSLVVLGWALYAIWVSVFPTAQGCHIIGVGGMNYIPANCLKYFIK